MSRLVPEPEGELPDRVPGTPAVAGGIRSRSYKDPFSMSIQNRTGLCDFEILRLLADDNFVCLRNDRTEWSISHVGADGVSVRELRNKDLDSLLRQYAEVAESVRAPSTSLTTN